MVNYLTIFISCVIVLCNMLVRTQLMLESKQKMDLEMLALATGRSMSEITRELLKEGIKKEKKMTKKKKNKLSGIEFLEYLAKHAVKGPGDSEYDKYAYDL